MSSMLATLLCVDGWSQSYHAFPGKGVDQRTRRTQDRVEEIYIAGDYKRARLLYEKELAPLGDKYAQYMVGYMYLNAEGAAQDNVEALAWFRVAAERDEPLLVDIRDRLLTQMSAQAVQESDARFLELWKTIGDHKLILDLIRRDLNTLRAQTGTRITGSVVNRPGLIIRPSGERLSPNFYADVRMRLKARIQYLDARVDIVDAALAGEIEKVRSLGAEYKAELAAMENP